MADITGSEAVIREARTILNLSRDVPAAEDVLFEMLKLAEMCIRDSCRTVLAVSDGIFVADGIAGTG